MVSKFNITILVAPLDWGLGHATRCVPLINELLLQGCNVIIGTEGKQEKLLRVEFPHLQFIHLSGYNIRYSRSKHFLPFKILAQLPKLFRKVKQEKQWLDRIIDQYQIDAVISDNRYGLHSSRVPCVFITHQLKIKAPLPLLEWILHKTAYSYINRFTECWVPDYKGAENLAGDLSHPGQLPSIPLQYVGALSRLEASGELDFQYDALILLSGPEPQRTILEQHLLKQAKSSTRKIWVIRGIPDKSQQSTNSVGNCRISNHLPANELAEAIAQTELIISRSGYTTIMDIVKLKKKSIVIPTPGQTEQEYLARHLEAAGICLTANQEGFILEEMIEKAQSFTYTFPAYDMDSYKEVVRGFAAQVKGNQL